MKIFFDTEFIEDGKTIEMLSIGLVREDGETYYAESVEAIPFWEIADFWVKQNVIAHLKSNNSSDFVPELKKRSRIAKEIVEFVGKEPEFWAYYADYDWVVLCQLYGRMIDLPEGWPMFCRDIIQLRHDLGSPELPSQAGIEHIAIDDALWNKEAYEFLKNFQNNLTHRPLGNGHFYLTK